MSNFKVGEFVEVNAPELKTHGSRGFVEHIAPDNRIQVLLKSGTNAGKYYFYRPERLINISRMSNEEESDLMFDELVEHDQKNRVYEAASSLYDGFYVDDEMKKDMKDLVIFFLVVITFFVVLMIGLGMWYTNQQDEVDISSAQGQQISENATMILLDTYEEELVYFNRLEEEEATEDFIWTEAKMYKDGELVYHIQP